MLRFEVDTRWEGKGNWGIKVINIRDIRAKYVAPAVDKGVR